MCYIGSLLFCNYFSSSSVFLDVWIFYLGRQNFLPPDNMFIRAPLGLHENLYPSGLSEASGAGKPKSKHKFFCKYFVFLLYFFGKITSTERYKTFNLSTTGMNFIKTF